MEYSIPGVCRVCGCDYLTPCETAEGPCAWAGFDLCTACEGRPAQLRDALERLATAAQHACELDERMAAGAAVPSEVEKIARRELRRAAMAAQRLLDFTRTPAVDLAELGWEDHDWNPGDDDAHQADPAG